MSEIVIHKYINNNNETSINELASVTGYSKQYIHRIVKRLIEGKKIIKIGLPPKVFYKPAKVTGLEDVNHSSDEEFLNQHFLLFTEEGVRKEGASALNSWCIKNKLPFAKTELEYIQTRKKYLKYYNQEGFIDGTYKLKHTKELMGDGIDKVFYGDFYAIERFGKTRLGWLIHIAKQTSNIKLMQEIIGIIQPMVNSLIRMEKIDAVGFIPPTIYRTVQIMTILEQRLNIPLPHIDLIKVKGEYMIPQKSLNKMDERINNARASIIIGKKSKFQNVLLIDDAIGSGATIFETAKKIKAFGLAHTVIGFAVTGSYKGFEVIQGV